MGKGNLQFYQNKYDYPKYEEIITQIGSPVEFTPNGMGLKSGKIDVAGDTAKFMNCNYIHMIRDGETIFAWIDEVTYHTKDSFTVAYSVDPYRTFKSKLTLGTQYVRRSATVTNKLDPLLGGLKQEYEFNTQNVLWGNYNTRVMVLQVNPEPAYVVNNTPVQPTPYHFYFASYNPDNWQTSAVLVDFFAKLRATGDVSNIITVYNLPYMNISTLEDVVLPLYAGTELKYSLDGFKMLSGTLDVKNLLTRSRLITPPLVYDTLARRPHTTQVMIPDAGLMNVPDEVWARGNVKVRQDVDLFSGASNYMITCGEFDDITAISVRGSSTSSIPIISNPYDTYMSQNQNALATSLIGDVASLAIGAGTFAVAPNIISGGAVVKGASGLLSSYSSIQDKQNMSPSNPPSFLGTAMANHYSSLFFLLTKYAKVDNAGFVNARYGYPVETIQHVNVPTSGYLELQNSNVSGNGTVPRWAIEEINTIFNNGLLIM